MEIVGFQRVQYALALTRHRGKTPTMIPSPNQMQSPSQNEQSDQQGWGSDPSTDYRQPARWIFRGASKYVPGISLPKPRSLPASRRPVTEEAVTAERGPEA